MELINEFHNKHNNITYSLYKLSNDINLIYLTNPATIDFDFSLVINAGCAYEKAEKVPSGTAHFLEHMFFNPNTRFKTKDEIDKYEQGSKERAAIYINGFTTRKYMYLTGHGNENGRDRIVERVGSLVDFPKDIFKKYFSKERNIIIAERTRKLKIEKDPVIKGMEFVYKGIADEFTTNVIGEIDDIKSIKIEDLEKFFKSRFTTGNTVFAIQAKEKIDKDLEDKLEKLAKRFVKGDLKEFRDFKIENKFEIGTFLDERASGTNLSFLYMLPVSKKINYKEEALLNIFNKLIEKVGFDVLREKKGLVYGVNSFVSYGSSFKYCIHGFKFVCENRNIEELLKELNNVLYTETTKFLASPKGHRWLEDCISETIFPRAIKFDPDLAEGSSTTFLEIGDVFNINKYMDEYKKIKKEDVEKYLKQTLKKKPRIWVESDLKGEYLKEIISESKIAKILSQRSH